MNRDFPIDEHTVQGLLVLFAVLGRSLRRWTVGPEGRRAPTEAPAPPAGAGPDGGVPVNGGEPNPEDTEEASRRLFAILEHAARGVPAEVRPAEVRPAEAPPAEERSAAAPPEPGPSAETEIRPPPPRPAPLHWRRLLTLPAEAAATGERCALAWLRAQARRRRERSVPESPRPLSPPPLRAPQAKLLHQAMWPTIWRIRELAKRAPEEIRLLLEKIAERFNDPAYRVHHILREAGATDWHGRIFRLELGISPGKLVLELRVETALWLLRESSLPVEAIARLVGYESLRGLELLFEKTCGFAPSEARPHLRRVASEHRSRGDELRSWYFWVRLHRDEIEADEYLGALAYLDDRFLPA